MKHIGPFHDTGLIVGTCHPIWWRWTHWL